MSKLTINVDGKDFNFGRVGFGMYLKASEKMRSLRETAFQRVVESLPNDPFRAQNAAATAIDIFMSGAVVGEREIREWLFSPEGIVFMVSQALKAGGHAEPDKDAEEFYELMSLDDKAELEGFIFDCLRGKPRNQPETQAADGDKDGATNADS